MRTGALTQSAVLPPGVAMRTFVHPQPIVLQVIIRHDNRQHLGPSASPGYRPDSIPDLASTRSSVLAKPLKLSRLERVRPKPQGKQTTTFDNVTKNSEI